MSNEVKPHVVLLAAVSKNGVIGRGNKLPWSCRAEMNEFLNTIRDGLVICGYKTWLSLPASFPARRICVVTRYPVASKNPAVSMHQTVYDAYDEATKECAAGTCYVIGGEVTYRQFLATGLVNTVMLSIIDMEILDGDAFFPVDELHRHYDLITLTRRDQHPWIRSDTWVSKKQVRSNVSSSVISQ